jgi:hypothetical protein
LATCSEVSKVFEQLAALMQVDWARMTEKQKQRFALFLLTDEKEKVQKGWESLHLLLWKHIIYVLANYDGKFDTKAIWQAAWTRLKTKIKAYGVRTEAMVRRSIARGDQSLAEWEEWNERRCSYILPFAAIDNHHGRIVWVADTVKRIENLC